MLCIINRHWNRVSSALLNRFVYLYIFGFSWMKTFAFSYNGSMQRPPLSPRLRMRARRLRVFSISWAIGIKMKLTRDWLNGLNFLAVPPPSLFKFLTASTKETKKSAVYWKRLSQLTLKVKLTSTLTLNVTFSFSKSIYYRFVISSRIWNKIIRGWAVGENEFRVTGRNETTSTPQHKTGKTELLTVDAGPT